MDKPLRAIATAALLLLAVASCTDDEERSVPPMMNYSAGYLASCLEGHGWRHVESHEVRGDGTLDRKDYWEGLYGESPDQYLFTGDTVTRYSRLEDYPLCGYTRDKYAYDEQTNRLTAGSRELFKVLYVGEDALKVISYNGLDAGGRKTYLYSAYRRMTDEELAAYRSGYTVDIGRLDADYPALPRQERVTEEDFIAAAAGKAWRLESTHEIMWSRRYRREAWNPGQAGDLPVPGGFRITGSRITMLPHRADTAALREPVTAEYGYWANSSSVVVGGEPAFRVLGLDGERMLVTMSLPGEGGGEGTRLFCVYAATGGEDAGFPLGR